MRRLVVLATVGLFLAGYAGTASADDHVKGPDIGIAASTSWVYDFNEPSFGGPGLNAASYPNLESGRNEISIDLVELSAMGTMSENVSYEASVLFGDLAGLAGDADSSGDTNVGLLTANITFPLGPVQTTVGRRATEIGYESLQPWANAHISRSYAWLFQPINLDGVKFGFDGGPWSGSLGLANSYWVADADGAPNDANFSKAITGDIAFGIAGWDVSLAGIHSNEKAPGGADADATNLNLIVQGDIGMVHAALEYNYFDIEAGGTGVSAAVTGLVGANAEADTFALYFGHDWDCWGLDARLEWDDIDVAAGGATPSGELWGVTITGTWHITDGVDMRLEYRHNEADDFTFGGAPGNIFFDDSASGIDDGQDLVALQVVMW